MGWGDCCGWSRRIGAAARGVQSVQLSIVAQWPAAPSCHVDRCPEAPACTTWLPGPSSSSFDPASGRRQSISATPLNRLSRLSAREVRPGTAGSSWSGSSSLPNPPRRGRGVRRSTSLLAWRTPVKARRNCHRERRLVAGHGRALWFLSNPAMAPLSPGHMKNLGMLHLLVLEAGAVTGLAHVVRARLVPERSCGALDLRTLLRNRDPLGAADCRSRLSRLHAWAACFTSLPAVIAPAGTTFLPDARPSAAWTETRML